MALRLQLGSVVRFKARIARTVFPLLVVGLRQTSRGLSHFLHISDALIIICVRCRQLYATYRQIDEAPKLFSRNCLIIVFCYIIIIIVIIIITVIIITRSDLRRRPIQSGPKSKLLYRGL